MACSNCEYRGYIVEPMLVSDKEENIVKPCPKCNDVPAYSKAVKAMMKGNNVILERKLRVVE